MNKHKEIKELLVQYTLNELSRQQQSLIEKHLQCCQHCRQEIKRLESLLKCTNEIQKSSVDTETCQSAEQNILQKINNQKPSRPAISLEYIRKNIMKNPVTKFAATAVVVLGLLLLSIWIQPAPHQEIEIPPELEAMLAEQLQEQHDNISQTTYTPEIEIPSELTAMLAEQLIELYYDSSQTAYTPEVLKAALERALEKIDPKEVIEIAKSSPKNSGGNRIQAELAPPPVHPLDILGHSRLTFPEVVEESNLLVHARILRVDINVDDIIQALLESEREIFFEDYFSHYRTTVQFQVLNVLPENALEPGQIITVPTVMDEMQLNSIKEGQEYFMAMKQDEEREPSFLERFTGIYPVDYNNPVTSEFWLFFADAQDVLLFDNQPTQETIDYWAVRVESAATTLSNRL